MRPALAAAALLLQAPILAAQTATAERATASGTPGWMLGWSPLAAIAEHPRRLPRAPALPQLLLPSPQVGLFWTAGNPAALPAQVTRRYSQLQLAGSREDGSFRRPLDADDISAIQFSGIAWQPVAGHGAAAGRAVVDQETQGVAPFADVLEPFTSNPLVVADSSFPRTRRLRARLEGAFGWQFGAWGVGLAAGVEVRDHRSRRARFPRLDRVSTQGVSLGVVRELPVAGIQLAGYTRWSGGDETITLVTQPGTGLVYQLEGYSEPDRREVVPPNPFFFRRLSRDAWSYGLGASGRLARTSWTAFWRHTDRRERHFSERATNPASDRWEASGDVLGGALQRRFFGESVLATGWLAYSRLDGAARRFDLEGDIFRADESVLVASADVRYMSSSWSLAALFTLGREMRSRQDFIAEAATEIEQWSPGLGVELARSFGAATAVSLGYTLTIYSATSVIPDPDGMGPVYQLLTAPELSLYATQALPATAGIGLRQGLGAGTALLLRGRVEWLSERGSGNTLPFAPSGNRTLWSISLALTMQP